MDIPLKTWIVIHICYREIFKAPISIENLKKWIGISSINIEEFEAALKELIDEDLLFSENGYLVRRGNSHFIYKQPEKIDKTKELLGRGVPKLKKLSMMPFIRYIGISGSVAAYNPTLTNESNEIAHVDLDIFLITKKNTIWLFVLFERIYTNINKIIKGVHFYCFNYVTEDCFLEVANKNFFTATEIVNLKPISDNDVFISFIEENEWFVRYYPGLKKVRTGGVLEGSPSPFLRALYVPNFLCFSLFCLARAIRRFDYKAFGEISSKYNPQNKCNLRRLSNPYGGYQTVIKKKFVELFKENFERFYSGELVEFLFPNDSFLNMNNGEVYKLEHEKLFKKYK